MTRSAGSGSCSNAGTRRSSRPYAVGLGVLMWVTAFIAAYTMYRHHRVLDAILLVGALLIANMSATLTDLFPYLVLFMLAALLLWLRAALIGREEGWQRRRVNENSEVPAAIMRSGLVFIAGSLVLSIGPHLGRGGGAADRRVEQPGHGLERRPRQPGRRLRRAQQPRVAIHRHELRAQLPHRRQMEQQ